MHTLSNSLSPCRSAVQPEQMGIEMLVDALWNHCYPQHDCCNIKYNGIIQYVLFHPSIQQLDDQLWWHGRGSSV